MDKLHHDVPVDALIGGVSPYSAGRWTRWATADLLAPDLVSARPLVCGVDRNSHSAGDVMVDAMTERDASVSFVFQTVSSPEHPFALVLQVMKRRKAALNAADPDSNKFPLSCLDRDISLHLGKGFRRVVVDNAGRTPRSSRLYSVSLATQRTLYIVRERCQD
jgi:hypothetical protein